MKYLLAFVSIFFLTVLASAAPKETVIQDFEENNGTEKFDVYAWDYGKAIPEVVKETAYKGKRSLKTAGAKFGINFSKRTFDLSGASKIFVYVLDTVGDNTLEFEIRDASEITAKIWTGEKSKKGKWTRVALDLAYFKDKIDLSKVKNLELYEWNAGVYYFDNVGFIKK
jgi:hypothetical protein